MASAAAPTTGLVRALRAGRDSPISGETLLWAGACLGLRERANDMMSPRKFAAGVDAALKATMGSRAPGFGFDDSGGQSKAEWRSGGRGVHLAWGLYDRQVTISSNIGAAATPGPTLPFDDDAEPEITRLITEFFASGS